MWFNWGGDFLKFKLPFRWRKIFAICSTIFPDTEEVHVFGAQRVFLGTLWNLYKSFQCMKLGDHSAAISWFEIGDKDRWLLLHFYQRCALNQVPQQCGSPLCLKCLICYHYQSRECIRVKTDQVFVHESIDLWVRRTYPMSQQHLRNFGAGEAAVLLP